MTSTVRCLCASRVVEDPKVSLFFSKFVFLAFVFSSLFVPWSSESPSSLSATLRLTFVVSISFLKFVFKSSASPARRLQSMVPIAAASNSPGSCGTRTVNRHCS